MWRRLGWRGRDPAGGGDRGWIRGRCCIREWTRRRGCACRRGRRLPCARAWDVSRGSSQLTVCTCGKNSQIRITAVLQRDHEPFQLRQHSHIEGLVPANVDEDLDAIIQFQQRLTSWRVRLGPEEWGKMEHGDIGEG